MGPRLVDLLGNLDALQAQRPALEKRQHSLLALLGQQRPLAPGLAGGILSGLANGLTEGFARRDANAAQADLMANAQQAGETRKASLQELLGMQPQAAPVNPAPDMLRAPVGPQVGAPNAFTFGMQQPQPAQPMGPPQYTQEQLSALMMAGSSDDPGIARMGQMGLAREQQQRQAEMLQQQREAMQANVNADNARADAGLGIQKQQLDLAQKRGDETRYASTPFGIMDTKSGRLISGPPPSQGGGAGGLPGLPPKLIEQQFQKLADAVSTVKGRGNLNRENQDLLNRADRLQALALGPNGDIQNLTPQQVREASTALANLIGKGSVSVSQIEELTPHTLAAKWADLKQKVLNEPQGADAQAFIQNMLETAAREKKAISKQILSGQAQGIPAYAHLRHVDQKRFDSVLKAAGVTPENVDENGLYMEPQQAAPAASVTVKEERSLPDGRVIQLLSDGTKRLKP